MAGRTVSGGDAPAPEATGGRHRRLTIILVLVVLGFFGFGFALVPLYNTFCKLTGLNGKTGGPVGASAVAALKPNDSRTVKVGFTSTVMPGLNWTFKPLHEHMMVHPGTVTSTSYLVSNPSDHSETGQAIMSVVPGRAARYFKKLQCFCFHQETLKAGQFRNMKLVYFISSGIPKDISSIIVSYAFFPVKKHT